MIQYERNKLISLSRMTRDCKENLVLVYDYKHYSGYQPNSVNLGDYIQSIAAMQFYEKIDSFIDRDSYSSYGGKNKARLIANGWYCLNDCHIFNPLLEPLLISVNISSVSKKANLNEILKNWKQFQPIGCRDKKTLNFLQSNGVESYFSACLTTTLKKSNQPRKGLVISDLPFDESLLKRIFPINRKIKAIFNEFKYREILDLYIDKTCINSKQVSYVTHEFPLNTSHQERFRAAQQLIDTYSGAELVLTSRIHAALPCLALGTPVILIVNKRDPDRYEGLEDLFNHIYLYENIISILTNQNGAVVNPDNYLRFASLLENKCKEFMQENDNEKK